MPSTTDTMHVTGTLLVDGVTTLAGGQAAATNTRASLVQDNAQAYPLRLEDARRHDHPALALPETAADDDFGIIAGSFGTNSAILATADKKTAGATSVYARWSFLVPVEYVTGQAASIKCRAYTSAPADTACTVDWEAYISNGEGGVIGSDIVTGSAGNMNSATPADFTLTLDATTLAPGVWLELRLKVTITDAAGASPVVAYVGKPRVLLSVKG